jgi:hypothetical protein
MSLEGTEQIRLSKLFSETGRSPPLKLCLWHSPWVSVAPEQSQNKSYLNIILTDAKFRDDYQISAKLEFLGSDLDLFDVWIQISGNPPPWLMTPKFLRCTDRHHVKIGTRFQTLWISFRRPSCLIQQLIILSPSSYLESKHFVHYGW